MLTLIAQSTDLLYKGLSDLIPEFMAARTMSCQDQYDIKKLMPFDMPINWALKAGQIHEKYIAYEIQES